MFTYSRSWFILRAAASALGLFLAAASPFFFLDGMVAVEI